MNNCIHELKQRAGIDYNPDQEGLDLFAELVIKECIAILDEDDGATHHRELLLEHFGVKE